MSRFFCVSAFSTWSRHALRRVACRRVHLFRAVGGMLCGEACNMLLEYSCRPGCGSAAAGALQLEVQWENGVPLDIFSCQADDTVADVKVRGGGFCRAVILAVHLWW